MVKLVIGAAAAVLIGAAVAAGATYAVISTGAPDKGVQFDTVPVNNSGTVDYGTP